MPDPWSVAKDAEPPGLTSSMTLTDFAWSVRLLVVHAPGEGDPKLASQRRIVSERKDDLHERDMVVIEVVCGRAAVVLGPPARLDAEAVLAHVGLAQDSFGIALVGKDSGVKLRTSHVVAPEQLFGVVDAMPMRQRERRRRQTRG